MIDLWPGVTLQPPEWTDEGGTRRARLLYHPESGSAALRAADGPAMAAVASAVYAYPDVSHYTPVHDWAAFWDTYPIAACKATEGRSFHDSGWPTFLAQARVRGKLPVAYHFLWPSSSVPIDDQADNFVGYAWDGRPLGIMLDVETNGQGGNPTMADASAWLTAVSTRIGVPRSRMLVYLPRWWWQAHGAGSTATRDSLLVNSDYRSSPNLSPFAGYDQLDALQFGSTVSIVGVGPGDMNRWLDGQAAMSVAMFDTEEGITLSDVSTINDHADYLFRLGDHGTKDPGHSYSRKVLAGKIDALAGKIDALAGKIDALGTVSLDVTQLTPDQLTFIGSVMAGRMVIAGIEAKDGRVTITLAPAA
jgi:hypothetical protein